MRNRCRSIAKDESGVTVVIIAICMTLFVGMLAYVVDIGYAYEMRRQLQSAADAAALAGMIEKLEEGDEAAVWSVAKDYAEENDLVGLPDVLAVTPPGSEKTIIDQEDFVQIEVTKDAHFAFASIFGQDQQTIGAQAKAIRTYVTSAGDLVPWGLMAIRPAVMRAYVGGSLSANLSDGDQDGTWEGSVSAPAVPSPDGHLIDIEVTNDLNPPYTQTLEAVGRITVDVPGDSVSDVWLDNNGVAPGDSILISVAVPAIGGAPPTITNQPFAGVSFFWDSGVWRANLTAPAINNPFQAFPIDIKVGGDRYDNAAVLVVQTNRSPFSGIEVDDGDSHWTAPSAGISVAVTVREFEEGISYTLKLDDGKSAQAGNFGALDYSTLVSWEDGEPAGIDNNANYENNLADGYGGIVSIGDSLYTYPGLMAGPTEKALETRFADCLGDPYTLEAWEADGRPDECGRRLVLPVYQLAEDLAGKKKVVIYAFAAFFVESPSWKTENITGKFMEEFKAFGTKSSDTKPDSDLWVETVRLAKPDY